LQTYEEHARTYIDTLPDEAMPSLLEWIDEALAGLDGSARILEIGSGPGRDADYIETKGYEVQRTDAAQAFIAHLQSQGHPARMLNILTDDIEGIYDLIFADAVLLHFTPDEVRQVLAKILAALRPGGRFAFSVKIGEGEEFTSRKLDSPRYFHYWLLPDLREILTGQGFTVVKASECADNRNDRPNWLYLIATKGTEK
jgi:SAM-dependent methyltransferase